MIRLVLLMLSCSGLAFGQLHPRELELERFYAEYPCAKHADDLFSTKFSREDIRTFRTNATIDSKTSEVVVSKAVGFFGFFIAHFEDKNAVKPIRFFFTDYKSLKRFDSFDEMAKFAHRQLCEDAGISVK